MQYWRTPGILEKLLLNALKNIFKMVAAKKPAKSMT